MKKLLFQIALGAFWTACTAILAVTAHFKEQVQIETWVLIAAIAGVASKTTLEPALTLISEFRASRRHQFERRVGEILEETLRYILDDPRLERHWSDIGLNAFRIERRWPFLWQRVLNRVGEVHFGISRPSGIRWTKGKGVIGKCWAENRDAGINLADAYSGLAEDEAAWNAQPEDVRLGLSYKEFLLTKRYGAVVATPINDANGDFIGCVSVDAVGRHSDALWHL